MLTGKLTLCHAGNDSHLGGDGGYVVTILPREPEDGSEFVGLMWSKKVDLGDWERVK